MVSLGYMTKLDTESIWNVVLDATRFGKINVRMGELLNILVRKDKDSQTDITDAKILPMLEQISEEALLELIQASKSNRTTDPWNFIQANVFRVISKIYRSNTKLMILLQEQQETKLHLKYSGLLSLRSHSD